MESDLFSNSIVADEFARRRSMYEELQAMSGGQLPNSGQVRSVGMYGGAQGIYGDKSKI